MEDGPGLRVERVDEAARPLECHDQSRVADQLRQIQRRAAGLDPTDALRER